MCILGCITIFGIIKIYKEAVQKKKKNPTQKLLNVFYKIRKYFKRVNFLSTFSFTLWIKGRVEIGFFLKTTSEINFFFSLTI